MNTQNNRTNLFHILNANAMFSFTTGLILLLARKPLSEFLGAPSIVMALVMVILFGYAVLIVLNTGRPSISRGFTLFTVIGDSAWVLASALILILPVVQLTSDAKWAIGIIAICVDIFATLQFLEWRKM